MNAAKVEEFVIKAIAEGAVQAKDIYAKALEYYKAEIATKKCEDFLSAQVRVFPYTKISLNCKAKTGLLPFFIDKVLLKNISRMIQSDSFQIIATQREI